VRFHRVQVVRKMPHPGRGFSQGLLAEGSAVWESVGNYGQSALRRYELGAGSVSAQSELAPEFFGEGICRVADGIWQLTWLERIALSWDAETLELREKVRYNREGWGMCAVGQTPIDGVAPLPDVVTSDGTSELVRRDPVTLEPRDVLHVRCQDQRVRGLNDLTWAGGLVWANVIGTNCLAGIDLEISEVTDVVDASAAAERLWRDPQAVMNGIAAVGAPGEFLLTGKGWRSIRQVRLVPDRDRGHVKRLLAGLSR
jgi:glutaminyl-peptide cyclotransferase